MLGVSVTQGCWNKTEEELQTLIQDKDLRRIISVIDQAEFKVRKNSGSDNATETYTTFTWYAYQLRLHNRVTVH